MADEERPKQPEPAAAEAPKAEPGAGDAAKETGEVIAKPVDPPSEKSAAPKPPPKPAAPPPPKKWEPTGEVVTTPVTERILETFKDVVRGVNSSCAEATVMVAKDHLMEVLNFLKMDPDCAMDYLSDLTAANYPNNDKPFQVVYQCYSIAKGQGLRVKVELDEGEPCPSAVDVWPGANWLEREAHDMFGIVFEGHPDLKVILLPEGWEGHPLRKDYPLGGPKEAAIRADKFAKPAYLPDDLEEGLRIIAQHTEEDGSGQ